MAVTLGIWYPPVQINFKPSQNDCVDVDSLGGGADRVVQGLVLTNGEARATRNLYYLPGTMNYRGG